MQATALLLSLALLRSVAGGGPPTWDTQVQSQIVMNQPGIGSVYLKWPSANNNQYQMLGYQMFIKLASEAGTGQLVMDTRGFPEIREYLQIGLTPGANYKFTLVAWNQDPVTHARYSSSGTTRDVLVNPLLAADPSVVYPQVPGSLVAGEAARMSFTGYNPESGNLMTVGGLCTSGATCVPGRGYVAFFRPICVLDATKTDCITPREDSAGAYSGAFGTARTTANNWFNNYPSSRFTPLPVSVVGTVSSGGTRLFRAIDADNTGSYHLDFVPPVAGTYSLLLQGTVPGRLTVLYWENDEFRGDPANNKLEPVIDFNWGTDSLVQYTSDSVSIRVLGYIRPVSDGDYEIRCRADTYCNVWIDEELLLDTIGPASGTCKTGCPVGTLSLNRAQYYSLRIDYVTLVGASYLHMEWRDDPADAFSVVPAEVFVSGGFVQNSPHTVTVASGRLRGKYSYMFLEGSVWESPVVGEAFVVYMQVKDGTNSACTSVSESDKIWITVEPLNVSEADGNEGLKRFDMNYVSNCMFSATLLHRTEGTYRISGWVNGEPAGNSPIIQTATRGGSAIISAEQSFLEFPLEDQSTWNTFAIIFRLKDAEGRDIANAADIGPELRVSGRLERKRDPGQATASTCAPEPEYGWTVRCFYNAGSNEHEFSYTDDSLVTDGTPSHNFPYFSFLSGWQVQQTAGGSLLIAEFTAPAFAGLYTASVRIGDTLVSGAPVDVNVVRSGAGGGVSPSMSLVQLLSTTTSGDYFAETDIILRVLLRDEYRNPMPGASAAVAMVVTPTLDWALPTEFSCDWIDQKYYECIGQATTLGPTVVSVNVDGSPASVVRGEPPDGEACRFATACGLPDCPCNQSREQFELQLNVLSVV